MESVSPRVVRFGVFEVDLAARELRKRGVRVRLQDQPFRVLEALLEKPGEIVTREDLRGRLWADDEFVEFDKSLNTSVQKIRQALGDSSTSPRFVETIPRRGYRFVAPVESIGAGHQPKSLARRIARPALAALAIAALALAVYLAGWVGRQRFDEATALPRAVPVTAYPGREGYPSFSPDGEQVAFAWEGADRENWDIYVQRVGAGSAERLTNDPAEDYDPVWSPDGRRIAFIRRFDNKSGFVMTTPAVGGQARRVVEVPAGFREASYYSDRFLAWHPDGRHLFFAMPEQPGGTSRLFAVDADTGRARPLMAEESTTGDLDPAVSPDGSMLAFRRKSPSWQIRVVGLSPSLEPTGESEVLKTVDSPFNPTWTPDGREILFTSRFAGLVSLWRMPVDGGEAKIITEASRVLYPTLAPSGRLAYASWRVDFDTWELQLATGGKVPTVSSTFFDVTPQYSPDGSKIAFSSGRSGYREIWICDRDGANPVQLTYLKASRTAAPYWAPDGSWVAFQHFDGDQWDIFVVRSSGGTPRNLTNHPGNDVQPTVSRDGRWIYFGSGRAREPGIWKISPEGGEPVQVTSGRDSYALESLDGKTLYISDGKSLWSMPAAGGARTLVLERFSTSMDWAVGRSGIYFKDRFESASINFYDFGSKEVSTVMEFEAETYTGLSLSPDGRSILYIHGDPPESDIMLVDGFR